eukprot:TRINITY_DN2634_c0_g2_i1.p1 TRINITY_DN2634_c0_g2~~TRINITY_DN2634_c0_g2_i1.p1  ORF type:complete len:222 (+),score=69.37 TRINITY_DN2634_c0_g2_i1:48-713(+)
MSHMFSRAITSRLPLHKLAKIGSISPLSIFSAATVTTSVPLASAPGPAFFSLKNDRSKIEKEIERYSYFYPSCLSLKHITEFGKNPDENAEMASCKFLMHELSVRFANMTKMIDAFRELNQMPAMKRVREWYVQAISDLVNFQRHSKENGISPHQFSLLIASIYQRHSSIVTTVAQGLMELKKSGIYYIEEDLHRRLDDFYMTRIGTRMLISQHLELFQQR